MTNLNSNVEKMREETAIKNKVVMDAIFDNVIYGVKDISLAVLSHHNTCMMNTLENAGIDSSVIPHIVKDIVTDLVGHLDEEFKENDIPLVTCAIASHLSLSVFESFVYANRRVKEEEAKLEQESKDNQVDKNETAKRIAEVYKAGKVSNEDLAKMIECNSITLGGIADHLGMDIANEVLRIASENLTKEKEEPKKEESMDDFFDLLDRVHTMTFDEFRDEMNSFSDEMKIEIMNTVGREIESIKEEEEKRNVKVIKIPVKSGKAIHDLIEALIKEAK